MCDFEIIMHQDGKQKKIGFVLNHNMILFVDKTNAKQVIKFTNSEIPETFVEVEWTIVTTSEKKIDSMRLS